MSTEFATPDRYEWVEVEPGRKVLMERNRNRDCVPAESGPEIMAFKDHESTRFKKLYGEELVVNYDLASKDAEATWHRYGKTRVGDSIRSGPLPFESRRERQEYMRRYGFQDA